MNMASVAIHGHFGDEHREWITPEEQLNRLFNYNAQFITYPILTSAISSPGLGGTKAIPGIANIIAQYAQDALSPKFRNWYTALQLIGDLPDSIPALPRNMPQILNSNCPIRVGEKKPDGTPYQLGDTHLLYLIPPGTLNELEARVRAYGERALNDRGERLYPNENPLKFPYFVDSARKKYGDVRSNEYQWILIPNEVLPKSRNKSYLEQAHMVSELSAKALANYEVPSLYAAAAAYFLHQVATKESLYEAGNEQNGKINTLTRVEDTDKNHHLVVGSTPRGLHVTDYYPSEYKRKHVGIVPLRRF
jgi:hypothetical protein